MWSFQHVYLRKATQGKCNCRANFDNKETQSALKHIKKAFKTSEKAHNLKIVEHC